MVRVLHLDDNRDEHLLIREHLRRVDAAMELVWAGSGEEALSLLERDKFQCILCDYQMPGMNGLAFLTQVRLRGLDIPCIFLTGQGNERIAAEALRTGADDYYTKESGLAHYVLLHNSILKLVASHRAHHDREVAESTLRESEELYRTLFEGAGDPIFIVALDGTYLDANQAGCQALGLAHDTIIGRNVRDFDTPENAERAGDRMAQVARESSAVFETALTSADGAITQYEIHARLIHYRGRSAILSILRNISERKKHLDELWLRDRAIETAQSGMAFADLAGRITHVNEAVLNMWGFKAREEVVGRSVFDFWGTEIDEHRRGRLIERLLRTGFHLRVAPARRTDGSVFWVYFHASVIRDREGKPLRLFNSIIDITELHESRERARKSEASINRIVDSLNSGVLVYSPEYRILRANPKACRIFQVEAAQLLGTSLTEFGFRMIGENGQELREQDIPLKRTLETGEGFTDSLAGFVHPTTGATIWTLTNTIPEFNDDGTLERVVITFIDITRRKEMEDGYRLRDHAVRSSTTGIAFADDKAHIFYANPALAAMWGYDDASEAYARDVLQFFARPREVLSFNRGMLAFGTFSGELTARRKDGTIFHVQVHASRVTDQHSRFLCWMGSFYDITAQKQTSEALMRREAELRSVHDNVACGIWAADSTGTITSINATMERMLGYSFAELQAVGPAMMTHADHRIESDVGIRKVLSGQSDRLAMSKKYIRKDGSIFWGQLSVMPVRDPKGNTTGAIGVVVDITEQMFAREELERSENRFRSLFQGHQTVMYLLDPDTLRFIDVNPAAMKFWGLDRDQIGTLSIMDISMNSEAEIRETMKRTLESSEDVIRTRHRLSDGRLRDVEVRATALEIAPGETIVFSIVDDITERLRIDSELTASRDRLQAKTRQLEDLNRELESFTYSVSHDLRAPLRHIEGYSKILADEYAGGLDETGQEYVERIAVATRRMSVLINDLLQLSRASQQTLIRVPFDLAALASTVADELQTQDPTHTVEFDIQSPLPVTGDLRFLKVMLGNLLSNARKFTRRSTSPRVEIGIVQDRNENIYFVRDNGAGFDPAKKDRLFIPFQRLHPESEYEGTGIGLSIVQRIVQRHGGHIWADSRPGEGATFYFTLPSGSEHP